MFRSWPRGCQEDEHPRNACYKGPEAGACLQCLRSQAGTVAGHGRGERAEEKTR